MREAPPQWTSNLLGVTFGQWVRLLWDNRFQVDYPFWPRAAAATAASLANSAGRFIDAAMLRGKAAPAVAEAGPIFILGHWRSGTTWLHEIMSRDPAFAAPNLYEVMFPSSFLALAGPMRRLLPGMLPASRLFDNMSADPDLPQEDEFALAALTGCSPYLAYTFPRNWEFYDRFLTLDHLDRREIARWRRAFRDYVHKLRIVYARPIILKSPAHTARIRHILELFPDARFVHIHRDPYEVFQSTRHMLSIGPPLMQLQRFDFGAVDEIILRRYAAMHDAFLEQRGDIPKRRLCELSFESLRADPLSALNRVYTSLELAELEGSVTALEAHLSSAGPYAQNAYPPLTPRLKEAVRTHWARFFTAWGYRA
jgi:omega-hydroxy-beta-dihydromenaquinone-9 sulfotransferase